jgi:AcrR family transcriptional regulator
MGQRATNAEATRSRIIQAATRLFLSAAYDEVSLEQIAARSKVALKTVLRRFRSKDGLLLTCAEEFRELETRSRAVPPGDLDAIVRVLSARYEQTMDMNLRYLALEQRVPAVAKVMMFARKAHWDWLAEAFAPMLPKRKGLLYRRRVAELFAATEVYVWHSWRRRLGMGRKVAEEATREALEGLISQWRGRKGKTHE